MHNGVRSIVVSCDIQLTESNMLHVHCNENMRKISSILLTAAMETLLAHRRKIAFSSSDLQNHLPCMSLQ